MIAHQLFGELDSPTATKLLHVEVHAARRTGGVAHRPAIGGKGGIDFEAARARHLSLAAYAEEGRLRT